MPSSASTSLVPRGAKSGLKDDHKLALVPRGTKSSQPHESTSRALVLREAAWGKGEIATTRKISGQEKLRLLAGEMMATALRAPFRMEELLKIAESQLGVHLGEIYNLKDPEFFCDDILTTINARVESVPDKNGKRNPPLHDPTWIASVVGTRIHNVYTLAGSWRMVRDILKNLEILALEDSDVRRQLRDNEKMRTQYLVLYDTVTTLARLGQQRVANSAAATPHYAPYFVRKDKGTSGEPEMHFDQRGDNRRKIREAHKSYIDAIILELILPDSQYPPYVLMSCLHSAVEECRREEKRFTQALWDAVGDLSVTIQVLDLLESSLIGPEGESWMQETVHLSKQFTQFLTVQASSAQACTMVDSWKASLRPPLTDTKKPHVLAQLWNSINKSYRQVSGVGIDALWSLQTDLDRTPTWSTYYMPGLAGDGEDSEPDSHALTLHTSAKRNNQRPSGKVKKQITQGGAVGSDDDDMPGLMSVSDSSGDAEYDTDSETDGDASEGDYESDYDPDEDEWLQDMLQDALDAAIDMDDLPEPANIFDADDDKGTANPFKRLFSVFKDRVFSANPTLKANEKSRRPFKPRPGTVPPPTSRPPQAAKPKHSDLPDLEPIQSDGSDLPPLEPITPIRAKPKPSQPNLTGKSISLQLESEEELPPLVPPDNGVYQKRHTTTIEEVEDEDYMDGSKQKKKKKKKKSKKHVLSSPASSSPSKPTLAQPGTSKGTGGSPARPSPINPSLRSSIDTLEANFSRTSLPLALETSAQSARSYLQENLVTEKPKVKTRPAFAGTFFKPDKENKKPPEVKEKESKGFLRRGVRVLRKGTSELYDRLMSPADGKTHAKKPMKWEEFLKFMREMGFSYDPSTAGSSVRFDPPDPKDQSITFHKPHPDPTLQRGHLRDFGKRLKRTYGWTPEQFKNFVGEPEDQD